MNVNSDSGAGATGREQLLSSPAVAAALAALERLGLAWPADGPVLLFGAEAEGLAGWLANQPGAPRVVGPDADAQVALAVGVEPLLALEPTRQLELLSAVRERLEPGGACLIRASTVFAGRDRATAAPAGRAAADVSCAATHVMLAHRAGFEPETLERELLGLSQDADDAPGCVDELERRTVAYDLLLRRPLAVDTSELAVAP